VVAGEYLPVNFSESSVPSKLEVATAEFVQFLVLARLVVDEGQCCFPFGARGASNHPLNSLGVGVDYRCPIAEQAASSRSTVGTAAAHRSTPLIQSIPTMGST